MNIQNLKIAAADGYPLAASLYQSEEIPERKLIVCNAGTCIPQSFYKGLASWLAEKGYTVLTYDYRGVGLSKPTSLKGFKGGITDWAFKDMEGIFQWAEENYPDSPRYLLAHSMGGQIMGLAQKTSIFDKIISIASSYGNYLFYAPSFKKQAAKLRYLIPLANWWYGYFPAKLAGSSFGEDWAAGVGKEWVEWGKYKLSFSEIAARKGWKSYFHEIKVPFLAIFIEDDLIATPATIPYYTRDFPNAMLEVKRLNRDLKEKIGHFGFFTGRSGTESWEELHTWLNQ